MVTALKFAQRVEDASVLADWDSVLHPVGQDRFFQRRFCSDVYTAFTATTGSPQISTCLVVPVRNIYKGMYN